MSIPTEILSLRRNRDSSVATLIAALDWQRSAADDLHVQARGWAVFEAADMVLLNVAAHAADLINEPTESRTSRRATVPRRRRRLFDQGSSIEQRRLFA